MPPALAARSRPVPADDRDLWRALAAGAVNCVDDPLEYDPDDDDACAAWLALDHPSWIGAVVSLTRAGPGALADADSLAHQAATFDFEDDDLPSVLPEAGADVESNWYDEGDELSLQSGFHTVALLWRILGAVDDDERLTELGWWGLPESLLYAWRPRGART